jgi:hypothetical protein
MFCSESGCRGGPLVLKHNAASQSATLEVGERDRTIAQRARETGETPIHEP